MRSRYEAEMQKEWNEMTMWEKMEKLRKTSMPPLKFDDRKFDRTVEGYLRWRKRER